MTQEQKTFNQQQARGRFLVENAICGIKRWASLTQRYRNKKRDFDDLIIRMAAGTYIYLFANSEQVY